VRGQIYKHSMWDCQIQQIWHRQDKFTWCLWWSQVTQPALGWWSKQFLEFRPEFGQDRPGFRTLKPFLGIIRPLWALAQFNLPLCEDFFLLDVVYISTHGYGLHSHEILSELDRHPIRSDPLGPLISECTISYMIIFFFLHFSLLFQNVPACAMLTPLWMF
jgi:hypothetical protein